MKKFNIEVTRQDEFDIEIDEKIWTPENLKAWSEVFFEVKTPQDFAEAIATTLTKLGINEGFYEGFGYIPIYYKNGNRITCYEDGSFNKIHENKYAEGIKVKLIYYDGDYECESKEIQ